MWFAHQFEKTHELEFDELADEVFARRCSDPSWHEVLRLIAGMIHPRFTAQIIDRLRAAEAREWAEIFPGFSSGTGGTCARMGPSR